MVSRRDMIRYGSALGAVSVGAGSAWIFGSSATANTKFLEDEELPPPYSLPFRRPITAQRRQERLPSGQLRDVYTITERASTHKIIPGLRTHTFTYNGQLPGPTIRAEMGRPSRVRIINRLPNTNPYGLESNDDEPDPGFRTSTHLHGAPSKPQYDGYANDLVPPGFFKDYLYENSEEVRTLWYHDHQFFKTTQNVYAGLAGLYDLTNPFDRAMFPQGEYDAPLMIKDILIRPDGSLGYEEEGNHKGLWGNIITVNGVPWPTMRVKPRVYRFRMCNASTARSYRPYLSNGAPLYMMSGDGGYFPRTTPLRSFMTASAERYSFLIDFSRYRGRTIELLNDSPVFNEDYSNTDKIMRFEVEDTNDFDRTNNTIPTTIFTSNVMRLTESQAVRHRTFRFKRHGGQWTISNETWAEDVIPSEFQDVLANPANRSVEVWTLDNRSGGWAHPVHIHQVDFKILPTPDRPVHPWENSPKDTIFLQGNDVAKVIMRFGPHEGRYMFHCHNTSHEDHDMLHQFRVGPRRNPDPNDPIRAVRPRPISQL